MADKIPLALNVLKLQRYNFNYFSCEEVVFFEYILVKSIAFKQKSFYHSSETIFKETGIKKHALSSIIKRFVELGYLTVEVKGMPKVKHFLANHVRIYEDVALIYLLEENGKPLYDFRKLLSDYFQPLVKTYQEKYINKHNKKEVEKEKNDILSEEVISLLELFNTFLSELKILYQLAPSQYSYKDMDLIKALKNYHLDELKTYLKKYYQSGRQKKLKDFLRFDSVTGETLIYIDNEKQLEKLFYDAFLTSLEEVYNHRIELHNKDKSYKNAKSLTKLVFNTNIKHKLKEALEIYGEVGIKHAFIAYTDAVLKRTITPDKFLPYFLAMNYGEFGVIETYLDYFNTQYSYEK
ncbi:MAG: hypothetical protein ACOVQR_06730 [Flavobacterium sp.]|jgi:hypothetical protein|uniref:hypothetical protein n=1 Tax=Flavobacterium sp. TaxID=239 RepID=UPI003BA55101